MVAVARFLMSRRAHFQATVSATALALFTPAAGAQEVRLLQGVIGYELDGCVQVKVAFRKKISAGRSARTVGDEARVAITAMAEPLTDESSKPAGESPKQPAALETLRPPAIDRAGLHAIEFDPASGSGELAFYFRRNVTISTAPGADGRSVVLAISDPALDIACVPQFDDRIADAAGSTLPRPKPDTPQTAAEKRADDAIATARAKLDKNAPDDALLGLVPVARSGTLKQKQKARELIGLAHEHKRRFDLAKAEYEDYLKAYPTGEGADRIRKRIAAIDAAGSDTSKISPPLPAELANSPSLLTGEAGKQASVTEATLVSTAGDTYEATMPVAPDPEAWTLRYFGSASVSYERNQGGRDYYFAPRINQGWEKDRIYDIYRSSLLSSFDYEAQYGNAGFMGKFRVAMMNDYRTIEERDEFNVSTLYYDADWKDEGISARIGRQSRFTGGVLGRFDGALASYKISDTLKLNAVAGSPVERSYDQPFLYDRYFYGVSADVTPWGKGTEFSGYFIDQRTEGLVDRQAVGAEVRVSDERNAGFGALDYDVHYNELNSVLAGATHIFGDQSIVSVNLDYRRSPLVFTSNALQGQSSSTLTELLADYTVDDIERFAIDRTVQSYVAAITYTQPINEHLQYNVDLTWSYLTGNEASAGVDAYPSTGLEFYASGQLVATDLLAMGDVYTTTLRYADTQGALRYMVELSARYPISDDWRLSPMLRLGYADFTLDDRVDYEIMPTLRASYLVTRDITFDLEVGEKWILHQTPHGQETETEFVFLTGLRYDFQSDPNR